MVYYTDTAIKQKADRDPVTGLFPRALCHGGSGPPSWQEKVDES